MTGSGEATDWEERGSRSSPHSFFQLEKFQMGGEISKGQEPPAEGERGVLKDGIPTFHSDGLVLSSKHSPIILTYLCHLLSGQVT